MSTGIIDVTQTERTKRELSLILDFVLILNKQTISRSLSCPRCLLHVENFCEVNKGASIKKSQKIYINHFQPHWLIPNCTV